MKILNICISAIGLVFGILLIELNPLLGLICTGLNGYMLIVNCIILERHLSGGNKNGQE